jgi:hypothetical protein
VLFALCADVVLFVAILKIPRPIELYERPAAPALPHGAPSRTAPEAVLIQGESVLFFCGQKVHVIELSRADRWVDRTDQSLGPARLLDLSERPFRVSAVGRIKTRQWFQWPAARADLSTAPRVHQARLETLDGSASLGAVTEQWSTSALTVRAHTGPLVRRPWVEVAGNRWLTNGDFRLSEAVLVEANGEQNIIDSRGARLRIAQGRLRNARVSLAATLGTIWGFETIVAAFLTLLGSHLALLAAARTQRSDQPFVQKFFRWCSLLGAFLVGAMALAVLKYQSL